MDVCAADARAGFVDLLLFFVYWLTATKWLLDYPRWFAGANAVGATVLLAVVAALLLHRQYRAGSQDVPAATVRAWPLMFGFLTAGILVAGLWHGPLVSQMTSLPIHARHADMLPLMLEGFKDLDEMRSPYRTHQMPWTLHNYYLPASFGPYYVAYRLGVDIRWVNVACIHGLSLALLVLALARSRGASLKRVAHNLLLWALTANFLYWHIFGGAFVRITQLGPYWLYVCLAFVCLSLRIASGATLCFVLMLSARESALPLVVIPYLWVLKVGGKRRALAVAALAAAFLGAIFLPFALADPWFLQGNFRQYSDLGSKIEQEPHRFLGFAGLFQQVGLPRLGWLPLAVGLGTVSAFYAIREQARSVHRVLKYAVAMTTIFYLFAPVAWEYVYVEALVVFSVLLLTPPTDG